jgi:protein tyrosine phosphatase
MNEFTGLPRDSPSLDCTGTLKTDISFTHVVSQSPQVGKILEPVPVEQLLEFNTFRNPEKEFEILKVMCESARHKQSLISFVNKLNRYTEVKAMKHTMVALGTELEPIEERYINASFIVDPFMGNKVDFIATQGPLPTTFLNFWKMIEMHNISKIYMICCLEENDKKQCDAYWPVELRSSTIIQKEYEITLQSEEHSTDGFSVKRSISLTNLTTGKSRVIEQVQVLAWPDQDVPSESDLPHLFSFIEAAVQNAENNPQVVHCSAGVGRTGTFIALFYLRRLILKLRAEGTLSKISIFGLVRNLKEQRFYMVRKVSQYRLLYIAVAHWLKEK